MIAHLRVTSALLRHIVARAHPQEGSRPAASAYIHTYIHTYKLHIFTSYYVFFLVLMYRSNYSISTSYIHTVTCIQYTYIHTHRTCMQSLISAKWFLPTRAFNSSNILSRDSIRSANWDNASSNAAVVCMYVCMYVCQYVCMNI